MFKKLLITILIISQAQLCWAECSKPVSLLREGQPALCDGFLFTREAEAKNYKELQMGEYYKSLSELQDKKINIMSQREDIKDARLSELDKALRSANVSNDINKVLYFTGGVLITYFILQLALNNTK